jgi:hypothetical protein
LEIHDRFHGISAHDAQNILWDVREVVLGGHRFLTCSDEVALMLSALSLHEDAETVRANTYMRASLGLKACYDVHAWLDKLGSPPERLGGPPERLGSGLDVGRIRALAEAFGIRDKLAHALSDVCEVFPSDREKAGLIVKPALSPWQMPYLERVCDAKRRAANGVAILRQAFSSRGTQPLLQGCCPANGVWHGLTAANGAVPTGFGVRVASDDFKTTLEWRIPNVFEDMTGRLVLQGVLLFGDDRANEDSALLGLRINTFCDKGEWQARVQEMGPDTVDGHANKAPRGRQEAACARQYEDGLMVSLRLEPHYMKGDILFFVPSVSEQVYRQLFRRVAGINFIDLADRTICDKEWQV